SLPEESAMIPVHATASLAPRPAPVPVPAPLVAQAPVAPVQPAQPVQPVQPVQPAQPVQPVQPVQPQTERTAPPAAIVTAPAYTPSAVPEAGSHTAGLPASLPASQIKIDGSSTVFPVTTVAKAAFEKRYTNVSIDLPGSAAGTLPAGTGGGFKKFCVGDTD